MFLVKLGGSVITEKGKYRVFKRKVVTSIVKSLVETGDSFVMVHGGGSFGHIKAKEYGLPGPRNRRSEIGFSIVHRDMVDLDQKVIRVLTDMGIKSIGIPPALFPSGISGLGNLFMEYVEAGFSPVTFGDVYLENEAFGIISGDDLMLELTRKLNPGKVIFLTDVDGIYDRNPKKFHDARLLKTMGENVRYDKVGTDVTGGMEKKASAIQEIARTGTTVYVLNGNKPSRIHDIGTERFIGTVIR